MKKALSLLLFGTFALALSGCVKIDDTPTEVDCELYPTHVDCLVDVDPDNPDAPGLVNVLSELPTEDITITFWHVYGDSKGALLQNYIDEFEELYPNITVDAESQGGYDDLRNKTILAISAGETPTLLVGYPDHVAGYLNGNAVIPLDDFIKDDTWGIDINDFIDSYVAENKQYTGGLMYSLPYSKSTEMVVINKTIFDANEAALSAAGVALKVDEPYTWAELDKIAEILVGDGPNQCEYLINYDSSANFFINSVRQWDGGYTNSAGEILVDNTNTIAMLDYIKAHFDDHTFALPLAWNAAYGSENFKNQDVCMTVGSTAGISYNVPTNGDFEIVVAPIPQYDLEHKSATQQGPNIAIMSNTTDAERLAAWLFIEYITNAENTAKWSMLTGYLPVRYSGYNSTEYQNFLTDPDPDYIYESMTANAAFLQLDYNQYDPAFAGSTTSSGARLQAGIVMEAIFSGTVTVQEAIDDMLYQLGAS
ncbi:MAG: extracellular solute-binding protein [Candidatus Izimaplasma sp.]|nr:extracellular solute-binding protein [Candidatus Izimaplasma bacterium]